MKRNSQNHKSTPAERKARVETVIEKAKAKGEKIPRGVKLIGFRDATPAELAHAKTLVPLARQILNRNRRRAVA